MSEQQSTAKFLRRYQQWRRGEIEQWMPGSNDGPNPRVISDAIDTAINALECVDALTKQAIQYAEQAGKLSAELAALEAGSEPVMRVDYFGTDGRGGANFLFMNGYVPKTGDVLYTTPQPAPAAVPEGYRLQPLSEYEAMRYALDIPEGNFPRWKEALASEMQSSYDTDGIQENVSGDPLIYLQSAIAIIEDFELGPDSLADAPKPAAVQVVKESLTASDQVAVPANCAMVSQSMPAEFDAWLAKEMPPLTVVDNPSWWAPRIWRAALRTGAVPLTSSTTLEAGPDLWSFLRDVLRNGAAIESQQGQQGYETFIARIGAEACRQEKKLLALLAASKKKGE